MKPHIRYSVALDLWVCIWNPLVVGQGRTPAAAYESAKQFARA